MTTDPVQRLRDLVKQAGRRGILMSKVKEIDPELLNAPYDTLDDRCEIRTEYKKNGKYLEPFIISEDIDK